jgi:N,N'-diacetyllegionaminate synthase
MLDGDDGAVDAAVSSTPRRFAALVQAAADAAQALGTGEKICLPAEAVNLIPSRRSVYAVRRLPAGHVIEPGDLVALRPGSGLSPAVAAGLAGRRLVRPVEAGAALDAADVALDADAGQSRDVA